MAVDLADLHRHIVHAHFLKVCHTFEYLEVPGGDRLVPALEDLKRLGSPGMSLMHHPCQRYLEYYIHFRWYEHDVYVYQHHNCPRPMPQYKHAVITGRRCTQCHHCPNDTRQALDLVLPPYSAHHHLFLACQKLLPYALAHRALTFARWRWAEFQMVPHAIIKALMTSSKCKIMFNCPPSPHAPCGK